MTPAGQDAYESAMARSRIFGEPAPVGWAATRETATASEPLGLFDSDEEAMAAFEEAGAGTGSATPDGVRFCHPDDPFEQEDDGTWHAPLTDGSELVIRLTGGIS